MVYLVTALLQIFQRMCRWNFFDNRSIFVEDMDKFAEYYFGPHGRCGVLFSAAVLDTDK